MGFWKDRDIEIQNAAADLAHKYAGAVEGWKRLQAHTQFPTKLKPFLPWVDDKATVDILR